MQLIIRYEMRAPIRKCFPALLLNLIWNSTVSLSLLLSGLWKRHLSKFWIYIQIIANLRPKTYFFIPTLERLVGIFPGFSATVILSFASQLRVRIIDGNILKSVSNRSCRQGKSDSEVLINYASSSFLVYY